MHTAASGGCLWMKRAKRNLNSRKQPPIVAADMNPRIPALSQARPRKLLELIKPSSAIKEVPATPAQLKTLHACIKKVTEDLDGMRFNTAISAMMVFVNDAITWETKPVSVLRDFLVLLAPFAPHLAEELWAKTTSAFSLQPSALSYAPWPKFDPALLVEDTLEIPVQVNGKLRDVIKVPANADNATVEAQPKHRRKSSNSWPARRSGKSSSCRRSW